MIATTSKGERLSPEGTEGGNKEYLPAGCRQSDTPAPTEPLALRKLGCENTGYWPQLAELYVKGMTSGSPDLCIFPYREKC